jgi:hypothetical protein
MAEIKSVVTAVAFAAAFAATTPTAVVTTATPLHLQFHYATGIIKYLQSYKSRYLYLFSLQSTRNLTACAFYYKLKRHGMRPLDIHLYISGLE